MKKQHFKIVLISIGLSVLMYNCQKKEASPNTSNSTITPKDSTSNTVPKDTTSTTNPKDSTSNTTTPVSSLAVNTYKIGETVYSSKEAVAWSARGYLGFEGDISNQFKAIFSKKGPKSGTYKVVSVTSSLAEVEDDEIGIYVLKNYSQKAITSNTGTATVTNANGVVTIIVSDVTMGSDKFSAHYVIGLANKYVYLGSNLLDYTESKEEAYSSKVYFTQIKTYASETSDFDSWNFNFYFGATTLADGTYSTTALPANGLSFIETGKVYVIGEKSSVGRKSDATSGTVTVLNKKITFSNLTLKSASETITISGTCQY